MLADSQYFLVNYILLRYCALLTYVYMYTHSQKTGRRYISVVSFS